MTALSREIIAQRIYDWSFDDAERELRENHPFVSRVRGENAERYLRFLSQIDPQKLFAVSRALVKRMNQPALLRQKKTDLTETEERYVQAYLQFEEILAAGGYRMLPAPLQPSVVWTVELRKALRAVVRRSVTPAAIQMRVPAGSPIIPLSTPARHAKPERPLAL